MSANSKVRVRFEMVPLNQISLAYFQPEMRTDASAMEELRHDVASVGVLTPITLVETKERGVQPYAIADGHRRFKASLEAGFQTIPAVVIEGMGVAECYSRQFITRRVNGREKLAIYLEAANALPPRHRAEMDNLLKTYGRETMIALSKAGASSYSFVIAARIDRYLVTLPSYEPVRNVPEHMRTIAAWVVTQKQQAEAQRYMDTRLSAASLWKAIRENRKLHLRSVATD